MTKPVPDTGTDVAAKEIKSSITEPKPPEEVVDSVTNHTSPNKDAEPKDGAPHPDPEQPQSLDTTKQQTPSPPPPLPIQKPKTRDEWQKSNYSFTLLEIFLCLPQTNLLDKYCL